MTPPDRKAELTLAHAELAAAFRARRCACGQPAVCCRPGQVAVRQFGILLQRSKRDTNYCLRHSFKATARAA